MEDESKKKMKEIFTAVCSELGALQEDANTYRTPVMKSEPVNAEDVALDFEYHVNRMIKIVKLFNLDDIIY